MTENQSNLTPKIKSNRSDNKDENTPLHYAAAAGDIDKVTAEIEAGHEIDPVNYLGWTPLMMATRRGHRKVVELLLEKRADSTRENRYKISVFLLAIASGNLEVLHLILQHLLIGGVSKQSMQSNYAPVSISIVFDHTKVLKYLIKEGFCVYNSSTIGVPPSTFAMTIGNPEILNLLTARGVACVYNSPHPQQLPNTLPVTHVRKPPMLNIPPVMVVQSPCYTPQPSYVNLTPMVQMPRRCSDMMTPCFPQNISPITGGYVQQVFFPQNFSPNQFVSPAAMYPNNNEFFNMPVMPVTPYFSPIPMNVHYNSVQ